MNTLQEILLARDERSLLRSKANAHGTTVVSLNLNIPGIPKTNPVYTRFFKTCVDQLKIWLLANRVFIDETNETMMFHAAGDFYLVPLKSDSVPVSQIKSITEKFELNHKLGRFIDVDVSDKNGVLFSSGKQKLCFFCQAYPALDCIHAKRHTFESLRNFQLAEIEIYLNEERLTSLSHKISSIAIRSILYELSLTPKPGLVDTDGSGIHTDMDFRTFIDSTAVISAYFNRMIRLGNNYNPDDLANALPLIRNTGLMMERDMFRQTKGINTQKGIIFLMGLSLFSSGFVLKETDTFDPDFFRNTIKTICSNLIETEFFAPDDTLTHGELCFRKYNTGGIRAESENGFPTIFQQSLPVLETENNTGNLALLKTLLSVMSVLNDTNILYRSDRQTLQSLQIISKKILDNFSMEAYSEIIDFCMNNKISPGGSADLLSITIFIFLMKTEL